MATRLTTTGICSVAAVLPALAAASPASASPPPAPPPEPATATDALGTELTRVDTLDGNDRIAARTESRTAAELAAEVSARWTAEGVEVDPGDVTIAAYDNGDGTETYVAASDADTLADARVYAEGGVLYQAAPSSPAVPPARTTAAAPEWVVQEAECFTRLERDDAWLDACYRLSKLEGEDKNYDVWALQHFGTGNNAWSLTNMTVSEIMTGPAYTEWLDWDPGEDSDYENCVDGIPVTISYYVELTMQTQRCEHHVIFKGEPPGSFGDRWYSGLFQERKNHREIAYATAGKVPEGTVPLIWMWSNINSFVCPICPE